MRKLATLLTFALALVVLITSPFRTTSSLAGWVYAFCEAALIGAIADWFAVVALFRHPLGVRLPHTAVIPKNQARLGKTLGEFIVVNFLSEPALQSRLLATPPSRLIVRWIQQEGVAQRASKLICENSEILLATLGTKEVKEAITTHGRTALEKLPWDRITASLVQLALSPQSLEPLVARLAERGQSIVQESQEWLRTHVKEELPWYVPGFVHDHVFDRLMTRFGQFLHAVQADKEHPFRSKLREALSHWAKATLAGEIKNETLERFVKAFLNSPEITRYTNELFEGLRVQLSTTLTSRPEEVELRLSSFITAVAKTVEVTPSLGAVIDTMLRTIAVRFCSHNSEGFKNFISETVAGWNAQELVEKIESHISDDLQYIRINGALVGGAVGTILYALHQL